MRYPKLLSSFAILTSIWAFSTSSSWAVPFQTSGFIDGSCNAANFCAFSPVAPISIAGTPTDGMVFDMVFDGMKHVDVGTITSIQIIYLYSAGVGDYDWRWDPTYSLSDETGALITPPIQMIGLVQPPPGTGPLAPTVNSNTSMTSYTANTMFHDIHFAMLSSSQVMPVLGTWTVEITHINLQADSAEVGVWAAVPEPATVLLMGLGLAGLGFARRRRLKA